jgi:hypothetical protein
MELQLGVWAWGRKLLTTKRSLLRNITKAHGLGWILWINDLS